MFVYYSSDHCIESRPWLGYLTFPAIVFGAFATAINGPIPEINDYFALLFIRISGFLQFFYMISVLFVVWTFGLAVCSKAGNIIYVISLAFSILTGIGLVAAFGEDTVWIFSWLICFISGMFLVLCPANSVDCFIYAPPFRTFSINGIFAVAILLFTDLLFSTLAGWIPSLFLNPLSLLMGFAWASILLRFRLIPEGTGDRTLWQWIKGENLEEDATWKDSWSEKRKIQEKLQQDKARIEDELKDMEDELISENQEESSQEFTSVLCKCGHVINAPAKLEGKSIKCLACNCVVHIPKLQDFN